MRIKQTTNDKEAEEFFILYVRLTIQNIAGKEERDEYELYWLTSCRSSSFGHCCLQITLSIKGCLLRVYQWCRGLLFLNTSSCRVAWNKVVYIGNSFRVEYTVNIPLVTWFSPVHTPAFLLRKIKSWYSPRWIFHGIPRKSIW